MTGALALHDVLFWGVWIIAASAVWVVLRLAVRPEHMPKKKPATVAIPISAASISTFLREDQSALELEAELAASLGVELEAEPSDLSWAAQQARRLGINDVAALHETLVRNRETVLRLAAKFKWAAVRRGDPLRLLFRVMEETAARETRNGTSWS
jgi:hypothetical protein